MRLTIILALALFFASASALIVGPRIYEQDDNGDISLEQFTYSLSADCNASTINVTVMDDDLKPVRDARIYVKYVDFTTPVIANIGTDKDGFALIKLPGNVQLMRGLFIMVIEKHGFRNKEIHFDLSPCLPGYKPPPPPPPKPPKNQTNTTNQTQPINQTIPIPDNRTNATNATNNTSNETQIPPPTTPSPICPTAFLPLFILKMIKR